MKKLCVLVLLLVLITSCMLIPETNNSIKGKWALSSITIRLLQDYDTGYESTTLGMFPEFDNYYSAPVMEITNELLALYMNLPGTSVFGMVGLGNDVIASEDSLRIVVPENDLLANFVSSLSSNDTLGLGYSIDTEGKLSIIYEIMDDHLDIPQLSLEFEFLSYHGKLPRPEWLECTEDDMYESDSVLVDTTWISLNERQERTAGSGDLDVVKFTAVKDSLYLAQVFSNMSMDMLLFDSLGVEVLESESYDSLSTPVSSRYEYIEWMPSYTGTYYLAMDGSSGYYEVLVEELSDSTGFSKELSLSKDFNKKSISREKIDAFLLELVEEK